MHEFFSHGALKSDDGTECAFLGVYKKSPFFSEFISPLFFIDSYILISLFFSIFFLTSSLKIFITMATTGEYRIESDTFGDLKVPAGVYWGAQTQR